jgi:hypothetical protein
VDSHTCRLPEQGGKSERVAGPIHAEYSAYAKTCLDDDMISGADRMLTGEKLTKEQISALEAKKKEREARCKPEADRLAQLQKKILAAQ